MALTGSVHADPALVEGAAQADDRRAARRKRYRLRESLWAVSTLPSVKGCGRSVRADAGSAQLHRGADGIAGWGGLNLCSSVSACPACSPRIRQGKAAVIEAAGVAHLRNDGGLGFATFTMRHKAGMPLSDLLDAERAAWKAVREDKAFRAVREAFGARYVKAWEFTYTAGAIGGNGWHPHLHVLWLFDTDLSETERAAFLAASTAPWVASLEAAGYGTADQFDLQLVEGRRNAEGLIRYLTKVQDNLDRGTWGVGAEMARGDQKRGRKRSRTPFELLASGVGQATDPASGRALPAHGADLALWHEYEKATKGLRVIEAARGLFVELGVQDVLDEDIPEATVPSQLVALVSYDDFRLIVRRRLSAWFLDLVEKGADQADVDVRVRDLHRGEAYRHRRGSRRPAHPPLLART